MDPLTRKQETEGRLQAERIPFLPSLPCVESEAETTFRSEEELGKRIVCLFCVSGSAFHIGDSVYKNYLKEHHFWDDLSPDELAFLSVDEPSRKQVIQFTWRCEALVLLMWAAGKFDELPIPRKQSDTGDIISRFPLINESPLPFLRTIHLRSKSEILDQSDLIYRLHWATRQAHIDRQPPPSDLNPGVIEEWHHAINWLTCYDDLEWDDVSTDT